MGQCFSAQPANWVKPDANGVTRHYSNTDQHPNLGVQISESAGSGEFGINQDGRIAAHYTMRDGSRPQSPRNRARVAELERKLFKAACDEPQFDHKPRETLRNRFLQFNTVESIGRIPTPPARVRDNPVYQLNKANSGRDR